VPVVAREAIRYPVCMAFRAQDLHDLDVAVEIRVETRRDAKSTRSTIVWVVVDRGQVFVRSVLGTRGRWYQEALATPEVVIDDAGRRLEARAVPVHDADSVQRVTDALKRKYADRPTGLAPMLDTEATEANFRLDPRTADERALQAPAYLDSNEPSELGGPVEIGLLDAGPALDENVVLQPHKSA
jgi:hypothetical protein